ncbi:MAG TPA: TOMM precursor leader peptide-binding protein [Pseudonocardiaceae bacterium]|nr:TOMM precursor leader peptide-binding protein [Pseudonocardiaceae bacterium]
MTDGHGVPVLRRHLGVSVVRGEGVYLLCEHGSAVVTDPLAERLFPLLDGKHDVAAITEALAPDVPADRVLAAVTHLLRSGQVVETDPAAATDDRAAGYWESLNLSGDTATVAAAATVRLITIGELRPGEFTATLTAAGLRLSDDPAALDIVLTDDYLRPELASLDRDLRAAGRPWLLAKPVGVIPYVGPVFIPDGACYQCLAVRLRGNRRAEDYLETRLPGTRVAPPPVDVPATRLLATATLATAAAQWLAGHRHPATVLTVDTATLRTGAHPVTRRPQCAACGDPGLVAATMSRPFPVASRRKAFTRDGGHRARTPDDMVATWGGLVDPITGVVPELKRVATGLPSIHGYSSGYNRAFRVNSLRSLRMGLRTHSYGKGATDIQARASALGEALERYSAAFAGDEPTITASYAELGADAVHPNASMLFSDRQFADRAEWNARDNPFQAVPERLAEHTPMEWTPVWSLTDRCVRHVPTGQLFFGHASRYAMADSNGCAAGTSLEDAALQGFYELVERDAVAIWWYNRLRRAAVDLDSLDDPWVATVRAEHAGLHREVWALDITSDLGVPVVVALSRRLDKPAEDVIFGFGAHHDARIACLRAVGELNQFLPFVATATEHGGYTATDPYQLDWWQHARVADHPYLLPDPDRPAATVAGLTVPTGDDLAQDLLTCQELVRAKGMELLAIDMTRPDIGLPVVKVMVPGMRHFWTRFAPGRLYDVPVEQGWLATARTEDELNPTAMFV